MPSAAQTFAFTLSGTPVSFRLGDLTSENGEEAARKWFLDEAGGASWGLLARGRALLWSKAAMLGNHWE